MMLHDLQDALQSWSRKVGNIAVLIPKPPAPDALEEAAAGMTFTNNVGFKILEASDSQGNPVEVLAFIPDPQFAVQVDEEGNRVPMFPELNPEGATYAE